MTRDENGRFVKGNGGGPGRPKKAREEQYYNILVSEVSPDDWRAVVQKAKEQAIGGDPTARKFLADYLIGPPVQKQEHTGADGGEIEVIVKYEKADRASSA